MASSPGVSEAKVTPDLIRSKKGHQHITFVTAYDFPSGKLADEAGFDMILVGDTLAEVVLGYDTTLPVTFNAMLHHTSATRRAVKRALLVADLPYGTYHVGEEDQRGRVVPQKMGRTVRIRVRVALSCTECTENCRKNGSSRGSVSN